VNWSAYNEAKTHEAGLFQRLLLALVDAFAYPDLWEGVGRRPLPVRDLLVAAAVKAYHGYANRVAVSDLRMRGVLRIPVPHFNSLGNWLARPAFGHIVGRLVLESALPLAGFDAGWSVDATGFGLPYMPDWNEVRALRSASRRGYRKLHGVCGNTTHVIPVAIVTDGRAGDSPRFRVLARDLSAAGFRGGDLLGDAAYLSRLNCSLAEELGYAPYFALKENVTPRAGGSPAWRRMVLLGREHPDVFREHRRHRVNVESAFSSMKRLFGSSVSSRDPVAQDAEVLLKVLCHNLVVLVRAICEFALDPDDLFAVEWAPALAA